MSFLLPCPNCGPRPVDEFTCTGEVTVRPKSVQREWWCHRNGCEAWFTAERDTRTNEVLSIEVPSSK